MAAAVSRANASREHELAALRLQEDELRAQQDALHAERLALALALGIDGCDNEALEQVLQLSADLGDLSTGELLQLEGQLAEIRAAADQLMEEALQDGIAILASPSITGAGPSSHRATRSSRGTVECLSCFDRFPDDCVTCAGADATSSSTASTGCCHFFCKSCATEYIRGAVQERKFPIGCPMAAAAGGGGQQQQGGCRLKFSRENVLVALQGHPKELQLYRLLEAQSSLDSGQLLYCPHKACSSPLVLDGHELPPNQPATCPACSKDFCPHCRIPGWHQGYTCAAFQALPAHLRSAEDAAMLQLSERQQWKRCPSCKLMVERSSGCNHMMCRCGSAFCYACGKAYTANRHGTPACSC